MDEPRTITVVAEKYSVAQQIAKVVGATAAMPGYFQGGGYSVTWAIGHLLELYVPGIAGPWAQTPLPIIPATFHLRPRVRKGEKEPDPDCLRQIETINALFLRSRYVIEATDAAREGELIFREIYYYLGHTNLPVYRLWLTSLEEETIRRAMASLRPASEYDNLYESARCRNEADFLVGINATRAMTLSAGAGMRPMNVGRVQTATLRMICDRYEEHVRFEPEDYWTLEAQCLKDGIPFAAARDKKYGNPDEALADKATADGAEATVVASKKETRTTNPPKLHDITSIQREANRRFGYTAAETAAVLQRLYEGRHITYPRTSSRYITEDVMATIPDLLALLRDTPFGADIRQWPREGHLNQACVNTLKVTDHHALLTTRSLPTEIYDEREANIYLLVALRMIEAFGDPCVEEVTAVQLDCGGVRLLARGTTTLSAGWKGVRAHAEEAAGDDKEKSQRLPAIDEGDTVKITAASVTKRQTTPPPLLTEDTLLGLMRNPGKLTEDKDLRQALKDCDGIGTAATRGETIKGLFTNGYVTRQDASGPGCIVPTTRGLIMYNGLKHKEIASVELTAKWEQVLDNIADGKTQPASFDQAIRRYTADVVRELSEPQFMTSLRRAIAGTSIRCPRCGNPMESAKKLVKCSNEGCGLKIFRRQYGRDLRDAEIKALADSGHTEKLSFTNKDGRTYEAYLCLTPEYTVTQAFRLTD